MLRAAGHVFFSFPLTYADALAASGSKPLDEAWKLPPCVPRVVSLLDQVPLAAVGEIEKPVTDQLILVVVPASASC